MREGVVGAEVDRQYPTLMSSESLTNEYALQPILQYGELFVIIIEVSSFNMRFQLSWFKHVTLNHGTAGSSPARRTMGWTAKAQVHKTSKRREHRRTQTGVWIFLPQLVRLKIGNAAKPGVFNLYVPVAQMEQSIGFLIRWPGVRVPSGIPYTDLAQWTEHLATNQGFVGVRLP